MNKKPSWEEAPEWAQWLAMDNNGFWKWYQTKPIPTGGVWIIRENSKIAVAEHLRKEWYETLESKPS